MKHRLIYAFSLVLLAVVAINGSGQTSPDKGTPAFGSYTLGPDVINLANLNVNLRIPVRAKAGRGMPFHYELAYNSSVWTIATTTVNGNPVNSWQPVPYWGWGSLTNAMVGYVSMTTTTKSCRFYDFDLRRYFTRYYDQYTFTDYVDEFGTNHHFNLSVNNADQNAPECEIGKWEGGKTAFDGSGLTMHADASPSVSITTRDGGSRDVQGGPSTITDSNGNQITTTGSGFTDTLGTTALSISGLAPNDVRLSYTNPKGEPATYVIHYSPHTVQTAFGCSNVPVEYGATGVSLIQSITLPDNSQYLFTYERTDPANEEPVTGRIASITLPTGGTIQYSYSGGDSGKGIECLDGSTAGMTRTTPDGTWTYSRSGSAPAWITTVSDPTQQHNHTVIKLQGLYETERQVYAGRSDSGTLLETITTCYNGNLQDCTTTPVSLPITRRTISTQLGEMNNVAKQDYFYDTAGMGLLTEADEYDYGASSPSRKTKIAYAFWDRPLSVTVTDGNDSLKAKTTYAYDENAVVPTTGTPQHIQGGPIRGNATTVSRWVSGSNYLTKRYTYYDTGNVGTATDVNNTETTNAETTYTYGACGNSFLTQVAEPLNLSRSMTWDSDCNGGVITSATDENSQTTSYIYYDTTSQRFDPFWRVIKTIDPDANATNYTYAANSAGSILQFNNNQSVVDITSTLDSMGRARLVQQRQGPGSSSFDTVETDYDELGRVSRTTLPYVATALGQLNSSGPAVNNSYDAGSRLAQVTDSGGGILSFEYIKNDLKQTIPGTPTKSTQSQYDGLGRLTSVCEITAGTTPWPGGACGQSNSATGYLTSYSYDLQNNITGVTQNAQAATQQTRSFAYDGLGRLTSETSPETGNVATTYIYDSTGSSPCSSSGYTSNGDLVRKIDANGTHTCYYYDALHRLTDVGTSRPAIDGCKRFRYDNSNGVLGTRPQGVVVNNSLGRLIEAVTDTCAWPITPSSIITDEWTSYKARGEVADVYQSTPHSGGYYHSTANYWANGALKTLNPLNSTALPIFTYTPDGEGRPSQVSASAGTNPVTSTVYSTANQVTALTFGTTDSDSFIFDPNTGRMTQYQFTVGATPKNVTGDLGWNANGTLASLQITDQFNSTNTQTCTYSYDDLGRITGVSCGSLWSQSFGFDPFGNLTKTGSLSFDASYNTLTNRISSVGSFIPGYDANGNTLTDGQHTYTWDADGNPRTADDIGLTYDALGRMVEQRRGSSYTQILYGPIGKLALMNGQTVVKAFIPLPADAAAVYNSGPTLSYFRHPDWLGSSRFASTPNRTMYYSGAYAPYGEAYAEAGTPDRSFTGQNQDTIAGSSVGLYDFLYREYAQYGRWISPDPAGLAAVNPINPQTWNRYAYVTNDPTGAVDPMGLFVVDCVWFGNCSGWGGPGGGGYYGGGSSPCTLDGLNVPCGSLGGFGSNGWGPCPHNNCTNVRIAANDHIYQWLAAAQPTDCYLFDNGIYYCPARGYSWVDVGTIATNSWWGTISGLYRFVKNEWFSASIFIPDLPILADGVPVGTVGHQYSVEWNISQKSICGGLSLGVAFPPGGKSFQVGPLNRGNTRAAKSIISGWSVSTSIQPTWWLGGQMQTSTPGSVGGLAVGTPGAALTGGYSICN